MFTLMLIALTFSTMLNVYQSARAAVMSRCHSWGIGSQGAFYWRLPQWAILARIIPVDVVHADIDWLKQLNAHLSEQRVNELLRRGFRKSDLYRTQNGDELSLMPWRRDGVDIARALQARLAALPLTAEERAAVGSISMTVVVVRQARNVRTALRDAVQMREELKRHGRRGVILVSDTDRGVREVA